MKPEVEFEWKIPQWSNAIERDRARTYFQAYAAAVRIYFVEKAMEELHAGRTKHLDRIQGARRGDRLRLPRGGARRAVAPRRDSRRQDRQLPSLSADPVERQPPRYYGTPGPYEDAVQNTPIFEENGPDKFKGIDIMRTVRSFDPCLPCGVHMYLGDSQEMTVKHSPTFGVQVQS